LAVTVPRNRWVRARRMPQNRRRGPTLEELLEEFAPVRFPEERAPPEFFELIFHLDNQCF
jgi:hypothetical protein